MPENPVKPDKITGIVFITHVFPGSHTVNLRDLDETVYIDHDKVTKLLAKINIGYGKVFIERDEDGDLVMYKYETVPWEHIGQSEMTDSHGKKTVSVDIPTRPTPMAFTFNWHVIREARRMLGYSGNVSKARAIRLLDSLLDSAPDKVFQSGDDKVARDEESALEAVLFNALKLAAERYDPDETDPGWNADMREDALRDAAIAYAQAVMVRRAHGA